MDSTTDMPISIVHVYDPTDMFDDVQIPIGKQTVRPRHIWYTPCSGIWQTVWLESAPSNYITDLVVNITLHEELLNCVTRS